jgi:hypothetical protein
MTRGWLLVAFAWTVPLAACDHVVFDHSPAAQRDGGAGDGDRDGGASENACVGQGDGAPCDDRDVCTPASSCRGGRCVAGNAFDACDVADTVEDFGETQGENGWFYGYWNATQDADGSYDSSTDFELMEFCGEGTWQPPGRCDVASDDPARVWTMNLNWGLQHPEAGPDMELPVRRWVSDVSGPARITAVHHGASSDGTRALLLLDGVEVWRNDAEGGDRVGTQVELDVELELGAQIEQIVHPLDSSADDMTYFAITISGR